MMPTKPDIAWFACENPPLLKGETLLCDGIRIVDQLQPETRELLKRKSFLYRIKTTREEVEQWTGLTDPDATDIDRMCDELPLKFSIENDDYYSSYLTSALHKPMFDDRLAFGSFLLFARQMQGWQNFPTFEDGTNIPDDIYHEIKQVSDELKVAHIWRKEDILMIDNTRFLHGRNVVLNSDERSIWTQFGYASFIPGIDALQESEPWRRGEKNQACI